MIRVLQVYPQMNNAGTERVIMNLYNNIDTSLVQFDYLVEKPGELDEIIKDMGGNIFYIPVESKKKYYKELIMFFGSHPEYQIVHTHTSALMGTVLKAAKQCGVKCRIAHSHNARNDLPRIAGFIKGLTSIKIEKNANYFFACSKNAAKWLFPHRINECKILYNGIKLKDYLYNEDKRKCIRDSFNISDDELAIIHVGRFARQKNHEYLVELLASLNNTLNGKLKVLLIGVGPLQDVIRKKVEELQIASKVHFLNNRNDVNQLLSAGDVFVFPSLHEGLGIVVIEAQANGLPCVVSDAVPEEADLKVGLMDTLSLNDGKDEWVDKIIQANKKNVNRKNNNDKILSSDYNIEKIALSIQNFYMNNENS